MDLITCKVKPQLRNMIAPFTDLMETDPSAWKKKLISCGNSIEQNDRIAKANNNRNRYANNRTNHDNNNRDKNNRDKSNHDKYDHNQNKHTKDRKHKGDENPTSNKRSKTVESVPSQKKTDCRERGDCIKCGLKGHLMNDYQVGWRATTPTMRDENNKEKTRDKNKDKSKKTDSGTLRISELGSEPENE